MKRCFLVLMSLVGIVPGLHAAREDARVFQLKEEIRSLEAMAADNANAEDRPRLDRRLEPLRQELAILEKRQALEEQEHLLRTGRKLSPREQLRETLQAVPPDATAAEARLKNLATRRLAVLVERDTLARALADLPGGATGDSALATKRATLEEKIYTADEQLRAIALQQVAADDEIGLVRQAQGLRERMRSTEAAGRPSLRNLFAQRAQLAGETDTVAVLSERIANVDGSLRNSEAELRLTREKLAKVDEELLVLGQQTGFLRRNPRAEKYLATERVQKTVLGERIPFLGDQVDALRKSRESLVVLRTLSELQGRYVAMQLRELQDGYLQLLYVPAVAALSMLLLYILLSRGLLPRFCSKERLFIVRRLGRYTVAMVVVTVTAVYLIEDIALLATTLGLVSAAIVISLQDALASTFAWFAIMFGRKFTVGDRLEVDGVRGEVLDVQILSTTLVEINNWLGVDQPTGRVLFVPNHFLLKSKIFHFSRELPYVWNKIELTITFDTSLAKATELFMRVVEEETKLDFEVARAAAARMERHQGVDDADYRPKLYTRIADSGITCSLIFVCHYRSGSSTLTRINRRMIAELEKNKDIQLAFNTLTVLPGLSSPGNGTSANPAAAPVAPNVAAVPGQVSAAEINRSFSQMPFMIRVKEP